MAEKKLETEVPAGSLELFQELFYSKNDQSRKNSETSVEGDSNNDDGPKGLKEKIKSKFQQIAITSGVRDPDLISDLKHRLAIRGLDFEQTFFSGWVVTSEDGSAQIDLVVRCKQPSILYRFLFDDNHVDVPVRLRCDNHQLSSEIPYRRSMDKLGCLVTVILLAAFIVPGIIWLYVTRSARSVWDIVHEQVVFPSIKDRLTGNVS